MTTIILIIHIVLALAIIGLVLLQRGTGGGLGLGESGGLGSFATPRSAANILTKATTWCAILFFGTSLTLAILASHKEGSSVMDQLKASEQTTPAAAIPAAPSVPTVTTDKAEPAAKEEAPAVPTAAPEKAPEAPSTP